MRPGKKSPDRKVPQLKSILVVDDEQGLVLAVELALEGEYRVLKATTAEEGLLSIKSCKPDLVLMDVMMPGIGGLEALKLLKSHPSYKEIPVIMMSGARPMVAQADYGWAEFLYKPFSITQLRDILKKHV